MTSVALALAIAAALAAQVGVAPPPPADDFQPGGPVEQPLPFSHRAHIAVQLKCLDCHAIEDPGDFAGFPAESQCMTCHLAIKSDSPHIQTLAEHADSGRPVNWNRIYRVEEFVYFSHEIHFREAGVGCESCHGPVAERDVLFQEMSLGMYACMKCHTETGASNSCDLCHDTH